MADGRAQALIRELRLSPHPEGGWYRETFRSPHTVVTGDGRGVRSAMTSIWFVLAEGTCSRWHRVASDEAWYLLEGGPLALWLAPPEPDRVERVAVAPSMVVPAGWWQAARVLGSFALAACVVAPGFEFRDLTLLADRPAEREALRAIAGDAAELL